MSGRHNKINRILKKVFYSKKTVLLSGLALVVFNILDAVITYWAVIMVKIAHEINPIMRFLLLNFPILFFLFKIVYPILAAIGLYRIGKKYSYAGLYIITILYAGIILFLCTQI